MTDEHDPWPFAHWTPGPGQTWEDVPDPGTVDQAILSGPQYASVRRTLDDALGTRWPDVFPYLAAELRAMLHPHDDPDPDAPPPTGRPPVGRYESAVGADGDRLLAEPETDAH